MMSQHTHKRDYQVAWGVSLPHSMVYTLLSGNDSGSCVLISSPSTYHRNLLPSHLLHRYTTMNHWDLSDHSEINPGSDILCNGFSHVSTGQMSSSLRASFTALLYYIVGLRVECLGLSIIATGEIEFESVIWCWLISVFNLWIFWIGCV